MKRKHEFKPIYLPAGSQLPINVYIYFSVGKQPLVRVYKKGVNDGKVYSPEVVPETFSDEDGYCERILLQPSSGDPFVTTEDFWIYINPMDVK